MGGPGGCLGDVLCSSEPLIASRWKVSASSRPVRNPSGWSNVRRVGVHKPPERDTISFPRPGRDQTRWAPRIRATQSCIMGCRNLFPPAGLTRERVLGPSWARLRPAPPGVGSDVSLLERHRPILLTSHTQATPRQGLLRGLTLISTPELYFSSSLFVTLRLARPRNRQSPV